MSNREMKLTRKTPMVRELLELTFPQYKGRTLRLDVHEAVYFDPYGGGGTFSKYVLVDMTTGQAAPYQHPVGGPFSDKNAFRTWTLPPNAVLVEHAIFQGKDCGIIFHVAPQNSLFAQERVALGSSR